MTNLQFTTLIILNLINVISAIIALIIILKRKGSDNIASINIQQETPNFIVKEKLKRGSNEGLSIETRQAILNEFLSKKISKKEVAEKFNVNRKTVYEIIKNYNLTKGIISSKKPSTPISAKRKKEAIDLHLLSRSLPTGQMTMNQIIKKLNIAPSTYYKIIKEYKANNKLIIE